MVNETEKMHVIFCVTRRSFSLQTFAEWPFTGKVEMRQRHSLLTSLRPYPKECAECQIQPFNSSKPSETDYRRVFDLKRDRRVCRGGIGIVNYPMVCATVDPDAATQVR